MQVYNAETKRYEKLNSKQKNSSGYLYFERTGCWNYELKAVLSES